MVRIRAWGFIGGSWAIIGGISSIPTKMMAHIEYGGTHNPT